jgi:hypothetical protein
MANCQARAAFLASNDAASSTVAIICQYVLEKKLPIKYENCDLRVSASFYGAVEIL